MAVVERNRPKKLFRATIAFGPYSKGARLQPTGIYRDTLLRKGFIEEIIDDTQKISDDTPPERQAALLSDRMMPSQELANRGARKRSP